MAFELRFLNFSDLSSRSPSQGTQIETEDLIFNQNPVDQKERTLQNYIQRLRNNGQFQKAKLEYNTEKLYF